MTLLVSSSQKVDLWIGLKNWCENVNELLIGNVV